ncbi:unnamed protein product [Brassica oleracea]
MLRNRGPVRVLIRHRSFKKNSNVLSHGDYISSEDYEQPMMSDYDFRTSGVLVILIPVHVNLPKERDLEKLMLYDGVTWQEKLGRGLFNSLL